MAATAAVAKRQTTMARATPAAAPTTPAPTAATAAGWFLLGGLRVTMAAAT